MELSRESNLPKINGGPLKHSDRAVGCSEGLAGPVTVCKSHPAQMVSSHLWKDPIPVRNLQKKAGGRSRLSLLIRDPESLGVTLGTDGVWGASPQRVG